MRYLAYIATITSFALLCIFFFLGMSEDTGKDKSFLYGCTALIFITFICSLVLMFRVKRLEKEKNKPD